MRLEMDCIPCVQQQALNAIRFNIDDRETEKMVLKEVMDELINMDWDKTPPELSHEAHSIVREEIQINDPYKEVKKKYNDHGLEILPEMSNVLEQSDDRLETATRISIAGNIIDFGAVDEEDLEVRKTIAEVLDKKIAIDNFKEFTERIENPNTEDLLIFVDNTGEIVFDKLLIEEILKRRKQKNLNEFSRITVVVKGGPILNDATKEDTEYVGFNDLPNIKYKEISNGDPNTGPTRASKKVEKWINNHDLVISKGQGNYEGLSQFKDVFFLLMAKCHVVADKLNVKEGDLILKLTK